LSLLGSLLQESASRHADQLGWGYASLIQKNCIWVLTALRIEMEKDPRWNDQLTIETWPSGKNRFFYYRDFRILGEKNDFLGKAVTNWIVIDTKTRKPSRPEIPEPYDFSEMKSQFPEPPHKWTPPDSMDLTGSLHVQFDDLDINNHVNNVRYLDWMLRSLDSGFRRNHRLKAFEIHFISEAHDEDLIQVRIGRNSHECQHLLCRESDGKPIAQACSIWEPFKLNVAEGECCIKKTLSEKGFI
jgi:medium-chain acyl-[acyl-carrier-protein] hydrolase